MLKQPRYLQKIAHRTICSIGHMKMDAYTMVTQDSFLLIPHGNSPSLLPKPERDKFRTLKFFKTLVLESDMLGLCFVKITDDFKQHGYSVVVVDKSRLEPLVLKSETLSDIVKIALAPQWYVLLLAIAYCARFLSVYFFQDRFGIHEAVEELIKALYMHSGILFLL